MQSTAELGKKGSDFYSITPRIQPSHNQHLPLCSVPTLQLLPQCFHRDIMSQYDNAFMIAVNSTLSLHLFKIFVFLLI